MRRRGLGLWLLLAAARAYFPGFPSADGAPGQRCRKVVVAGMQATGSTLMYQLVQGLPRRRFEVRKQHGVADWQRLVRDNCTLFSVRDFRDVLCSHARRHGGCAACAFGSSKMRDAVRKELDDLFGPGRMWEPSKLRFLRDSGRLLFEYREFALNSLRFVAWASKYFALGLNSSAMTELVERYSLGANTARQAAIGSTFKTYDRQIQLHGYHISSNGTVGAWRSCLDNDTVAEVEALLGDVMVRYGYELAIPAA